MSLVSIRFSGVTAPEDCAVDDNAHLLNGSSGPHVALVQQALMDLGHDLAGGADGIYGTATGNAVFDYKTERGILAPGAVAADRIVGKRTIAALDAEIEAFDENPPDCFDPGAPVGAVTLSGIPGAGVNALFGRFGLGPFAAVDDDGQMADLTAGNADPNAELAVASDAVDLLSGTAPAAVLGASLVALAAAPAFLPFPETQLSLVASPGSVLDLSLLTGDLLAQLLTPPVAPVASIPARDLTPAQALAEALAAHTAGEIRLTPDPSITPPASGSRLGLVDNVVAGVTFLVANVPSRLSKHPVYAPGPAPLRTLDARHLVGLVRLCRHMATNFGLTELHHIGVNGDLARLGGDCHQAGRACDLIGLRGVHAGSPFLVTVLDDWGGQSVPDLAHPGKRLPDWPHVTMRTRYRLADHPTIDPFVRDIWQGVYDFLATQYQDTTQGPGATGSPTAIGGPSSIMTPDHPTSHQKEVTKDVDVAGVPTKRTFLVAASDGREAHRGHVHFQTGVTGTRLP